MSADEDHRGDASLNALERVVIAGHSGDEAVAQAGLDHDDPAVRVAALGALDRLEVLAASTLSAALIDPATLVRARACELAAARFEVSLLELLDDPDPIVVEVAAWATGEQLQGLRHDGIDDTSDDQDDGPGDDEAGEAIDDEPGGPRGPAMERADADRCIERLIELGRSAEAPLVREAAIAALGAVGDARGVDITLHAASSDRPAVRRRAVVALAAYDDDRVLDALRTALEDRDWQVRGAAEDLLRAIDLDNDALDDPPSAEH